MAEDASKSQRPGSGRSGSGRPGSGRSGSGRAGSDRSRGGSPGKGRSTGGRSGADRSGSPGKGAGGRGSSASSRAGRPSSKPRDDARPRGPREPHLADDVVASELDPAVLNELRTLPEGLADIVARHLVAADRALVDENTSLAREHIAAAKRRAGRVAAVREAAGIAAYLDGDYAEAIAELRAVRRMTGSLAYVPMMADCERGLGEPRKALDLLKAVDPRTLDPDTRVEAALVGAGARADLGQVDAALLLLQSAELKALPAGTPRARVELAYADLLEQADRAEEARAWVARAAASDIDGATDAAERLAGELDIDLWSEDGQPPIGSTES